MVFSSFLVASGENPKRKKENRTDSHFGHDLEVGKIRSRHKFFENLKQSQKKWTELFRSEKGIQFKSSDLKAFRNVYEASYDEIRSDVYYDIQLDKSSTPQAMKLISEFGGRNGSNEYNLSAFSVEKFLKDKRSEGVKGQFSFFGKKGGKDFDTLNKFFPQDKKVDYRFLAGALSFNVGKMGEEVYDIRSGAHLWGIDYGSGATHIYDPVLLKNVLTILPINASIGLRIKTAVLNFEFEQKLAEFGASSIRYNNGIIEIGNLSAGLASEILKDPNFREESEIFIPRESISESEWNAFVERYINDSVS
ncbi:MAG: hypothetical protein JSS34_00935 [Proteobacteria bacterium]|nr:hypothetical protein [Pseudomonadota bacterium]